MRIFLVGLLVFAGLVPAVSEVVRIDLMVSPSRSAGSQIEDAARAFNQRFASLTRLARRRGSVSIPFSMPLTIHLSVGSTVLPPALDRGGPLAGDIALLFDASGARAFPSAYKTFLEDVFIEAKNTMNVIFGSPALAGPIHVRNYDADIGDRDAVAGGIYLPNNGSGEAEIRFPIYSSPEAAAVNFVHTLLLAYQGATPYGFDAFQEGLARAATMKICRTPGALPASLDAELIEAALQNLYDVGLWYDWYNQPALGGAQFIAPNLRTVPLPSGGSLGGVYLLRYQMAGSAWQKLVAENAGFIAEFNRRFYLNPTVYSNVNALVVMGQAALNTVKGAANSTVEGLSFAEWFQRQRILETRDTLGLKLLVQPTPLPPVTGSTDFGVFDVVAHFFETLTGGNEVLSSGTAYPIFWDNDFNRIFPSAQEDRMDIAGAYGSVTPNLPDQFAGQPYRCTIDIPVFDRIARAYVPVGSIATGTSTEESNFYGTLIGLPLDTGDTVRVRVRAGSFTFENAPVVNGAFGVRITDSSFTGYAALTVEVVKTVSSNDTVVMTRLVNKGPGPLALDLRIDGETTYVFPAITKGMSLVGFPLEPYRSDLANIFGLASNTFLAARYNASRARYDFYPDFGPGRIGNGYYVRLNAPMSLSVKGRTHPGTPVAVALRPGWNMVTSPLLEDVITDRVRVVRAADFPKTFTEAIGIELGLDFFQFIPGDNDAATGAPETGTMTASSVFRAGKGYMVRCLAPEGATLLFDPAEPTPSRGGVSDLFGSADRVVRAAVTHNGKTALAYFGNDRVSTRGFDRLTDSSLPPKPVGGLQVTIGDDRYRDLRRTGVIETYRIRLDGLVPGQSYSLKFANMKGQSGILSLYDPITYRRVQLRAPSSYDFEATRAFRWVDVTVGGR